MKRIFAIFITLLIISTGNTALAEIEAVAINGKRVLLKDNHTWEYVGAQPPDARYARLSVAHLDGGSNYCRVGVRLKNDLVDKITSIILMFSAYVGEEVRYETVTKGFQHLKPTNDRYNELTFSGLSCDEIKYIRVHGADRCEVGDLNKFSSNKGQCLKLVEVEPSKEIVIFKRYDDDPPQPEPARAKAEGNGEATLEQKWARELQFKKLLGDPPQ